MSQFSDVLTTVLWAGGFAFAGILVGSGVELYLNPLLHKAFPHALLLRSTIQLAVSLAVLAETLVMVVPPGSDAPISDGIMMVFLILFQPRLLSDLGRVVETLLNVNMKGLGPAKHVPAETPKAKPEDLPRPKDRVERPPTPDPLAVPATNGATLPVPFAMGEPRAWSGRR
jgi:hypothetical protein